MLEPTTVYTPSPNRYDSMTYNHAGESGLKLPAISLGFWHNFGDTTPYDTMRRIVFTAFDNGITHFDLANNYGPASGSAEENFGKIFAGRSSQGFAKGFSAALYDAINEAYSTIGKNNKYFL